MTTILPNTSYLTYRGACNLIEESSCIVDATFVFRSSTVRLLLRWSAIISCVWVGSKHTPLGLSYAWTLDLRLVSFARNSRHFVVVLQVNGSDAMIALVADVQPAI